MPSNTYLHAKQELDLLLENVKEPIVGPFIPEILAIAEKFGSSGQSGGSAPYTIGAIASCIQKLLSFQPLIPIMGIDEEWVDVTEQNGGNTLFQNKRDPRVFKDDSDAWFLDAIVWVNDEFKWTGGAIKINDTETIGSVQYIKSFPFTPETFFIEVDDNDLIKDPKQLDAVWEHYNKKPLKP